MKLSFFLAIFISLSIFVVNCQAGPKFAIPPHLLPNPELTLAKFKPDLDNALTTLIAKVVTDGSVNVQFSDSVWTEKTALPGLYSYKVCTRIALLNVTCVEAYVSVKDLTTGIRLTTDGVTLLSRSSPSTKECVSEETLLKLIALIPELAPFRIQINSVLKFFQGHIPGDLFSICVYPQNFQITKDYLNGTLEFSAGFLCWKGKCYKQHYIQLGSFNLPFTAEGGKASAKFGKKKRHLNPLHKTSEQTSEIQKHVKRSKRSSH